MVLKNVDELSDEGKDLNAAGSTGAPTEKPKPTTEKAKGNVKGKGKTTGKGKNKKEPKESKDATPTKADDVATPKRPSALRKPPTVLTPSKRPSAASPPAMKKPAAKGSKTTTSDEFKVYKCFYKYGKYGFKWGGSERFSVTQWHLVQLSLVDQPINC